MVSELKMSSDIDPAANYKTEDEQYIAKLSPEERDILFKVVRRMIRDKKRRNRLDLLKNGNVEEANRIVVSDDSDSGAFLC